MTRDVILVLGTKNAKKLRELAQLIAPAWDPNPRLGRLDVRSLDAFGPTPDVEEDAPDFAGNARKKASETALALGQWALSDDSGLMVDALGGAPGVFSARYAGVHGADDANNLKLLDVMKDVPDTERGAAFACALAVSDPQGKIHLEAQGFCRGRITRDWRGPQGFGYDPLFLIPEYHKTFGELGPIAKAQLSHRARAFEKLRPALDRLIASGSFDIA